MPDIYIYGAIGKGFDPFTGTEAISSKQVIAQLNKAGGADVNLRINSDGGDVFEAKAIMEAVARYEGDVTAYIDAVAASAASFVVMTADEVLAAPGSQMMLHDPWTAPIGNAAELRRVASLLETVRDNTIIPAYRERTLLVAAELREMLAEETWLDSDLMVEMGFADGLSREIEDDREPGERLGNVKPPQPFIRTRTPKMPAALRVATAQEAREIIAQASHSQSANARTELDRVRKYLTGMRNNRMMPQ